MLGQLILRNFHEALDQLRGLTDVEVADHYSRSDDTNIMDLHKVPVVPPTPLVVSEESNATGGSSTGRVCNFEAEYTHGAAAPLSQLTMQFPAALSVTWTVDETFPGTDNMHESAVAASCIEAVADTASFTKFLLRNAPSTRVRCVADLGRTRYQAESDIFWRWVYNGWCSVVPKHPAGSCWDNSPVGSLFAAVRASDVRAVQYELKGLHERGDDLFMLGVLLLTQALDSSKQPLDMNWVDVLETVAQLLAPQHHASESAPVVVTEERLLTRLTIARRPEADTKVMHWRLFVPVPPHADSLSVTRVTTNESLGAVNKEPCEIAVVRTGASAEDNAPPAVKQLYSFASGPRTQKASTATNVTLLSVDEGVSTCLKRSQCSAFFIGSLEPQQIDIALSASVPLLGTKWSAYASQAVELLIEIAGPRLLQRCALEKSPFGVLPLFDGGLGDTRVDPDDVGIDACAVAAASLKQRLGVREGDWQWSVLDSVFAALASACPLDEVVGYLARRWRLEWVSDLQGAANVVTREALVGLCKFVVSTGSTRPRTATVVAAARQLRSLLSANATPKAIENRLSQVRTAARTVRVLLSLAAPFSSCFRSLVELWLVECSPCGSVTPLLGSPADDVQAVRNSLLAALASSDVMPNATRVAKSHSFTPDDLTTLIERSQSRVASTGARLTPNALSASKPGLRISFGVSGRYDIEKTSMGTQCLRAQRPWALTAPSAAYYFEVTFGEKHLKRALVGVCAPQDILDSVSYIRSDVRQRSCLIDSDGLGHCVAFGDNDTVGFGVKVAGASRRYFWTLNSVLVYEGPLTAAGDVVIPCLTYETSDRSMAHVNFGQAPFAWDASRLFVATDLDFRALLLRQAASSEAMHDWLLSSLASDANACSRLWRDVALQPQLSARNAVVLLRLCLSSEPALAIDTAHFCDIVHVVQQLLHRGCPVDPSDASFVARLLQHAGRLLSGAPPLTLRSDLCPWWHSSNEETSTVVGTVVQLQEKQYLAHAVGMPLPAAGTFSFSMFINYGGTEQKSVQNYGQFYIGVTTLSVAELSTGVWKDAKPPSVWAVHSIRTAQLPHCNDSAFAGDSYTFSSNSIVTIDVDRERGTLSLSRAGKRFADVFSDIPQDAVLRPFVQLVEEKSSAVLLPGKCDGYPTVDKCLTSATVQLQRTALLRHDTSALTAEALSEALRRFTEADSLDRPLLMTLGALGDPAQVNIISDTGELVPAELRDVDAAAGISRVWVPREGKAVWLPNDWVQPRIAACCAYNIAALNERGPDLTDPEDDGTPLFTADGVRRCLEVAVDALTRWQHNVVSTSRLMDEEEVCRAAIESEARREQSDWERRHAKDAFTKQLHWNQGLMTGLLQNATVPKTYTFCPDMCSPELAVVSHYHGKLVLSPHKDTGNGDRYVAIANEAIPMSGIATVRVKVEFDWLGLLALSNYPMSEGMYVGVCDESYHGEVVDHTAVSPPQLWAITSADTKPFHLPHSSRPLSRTQLVYSRDVLRIQINRDKGTMEVFRTPYRSAEYSLGIVFDNLPKGGTLFPFVQITSPRTSVMFLPESAQLPRAPQNLLRYAPTVRSKGQNCDGCLNQLVASAVEAPNWYRCNQCLNFDLCGSCFQQHFHCGHTFSHMRLVAYMPSVVANTAAVLQRGADVEMHAAPLVPLYFENCAASEEDFCSTILCSPGACLAVFGAVRRPQTPFECSLQVQESSDAQLRFAVGVAPLAYIENKSAEDVIRLISNQRGACPEAVVLATSSLGVLPCGTRSLTARQSCRSWSPADGAVIQISKESEVSMLCRGTTVRVFAHTVNWQREPLCVFFVASSHSSVTATLSTPLGTTMTGKVGEVHAKERLARVTNGVANRWAAASLLHVPLVPVPQHSALRVGMRVCAVVRVGSDKGKVDCVVVRVGDVDQPIWVHDGTREFAVALDAVFTTQDVLDVKDPDADHMYPVDKRRLRRFYAAYGTAKTDAEMDKALDLYAKSSRGLPGLWVDLAKKYGPEPCEAPELPEPKRRHGSGVPAQSAMRCAYLLKCLVHCTEDAATRQFVLHAVPLLQPLFSCTSSHTSHTGVSHGPRLDTWCFKIESDIRQGFAAPAVFSPRAELCSDVFFEDEPQALAQVAQAEVTDAAKVMWDGELFSSKSFRFKVGVNPSTMRLTLEFSEGTNAGQCCVTYVLSRFEFSPASQTMTMAAAAPDDKDAAMRVAVVCADVRHHAARLPIDVGAAEAFVFIGSWEPLSSAVVGEWQTTEGHRGYGCLRPVNADGSACTATQLGLLCTLQPPQRIFRRDVEAGGTPTINGLLAVLAQSLRLESISALHGEAQNGVLEVMLSAFSRFGLARLRTTVREFLSGGGARDRLVRECWSACMDTTRRESQRVGAAVVFAHLCDESANRSELWTALRAVTEVVHRHWNCVDAAEALASVTRRLQPHQQAAASVLLRPLASFLSRVASSGVAEHATLLAAFTDAFAPLSEHLDADGLPSKGVLALVDIAASLQETKALPQCVDRELAHEEDEDTWIALGSTSMLVGDRLIVGTVYSGSALKMHDTPLYMEVETSGDAHVQLGLCTSSFLETSRRNASVSTRGTVIGFDENSVGFDGTSFVSAGKARRLGRCVIVGRETVGMLVQHVSSLGTIMVQFFVNGLAVAPPQAAGLRGPVHAVVRASRSSSGCGLRSLRSQLTGGMPPGAVALNAPATNCAAHYCAALRSSVAPVSIGEWVQVAHGGQTMLPLSDLHRQWRNVNTIMKRVLPYVDMRREAASSPVLRALPTLKLIMSNQLRNSLLVFPALEAADRNKLPQVAVRWFQLFSHHSRTAQEALDMSVLAQLHRQLGGASLDKVMQRDPMFTTALMMTEAPHTPIDAGGPYSQAWSLVAEELMTDPAGSDQQQGAGPTGKQFHRNPLFRIVTSRAKGKVLIPDAAFSSPQHLSLLHFFGALLGYLVRSKRCLALELSPVVWKFLVEDPLTAEDFIDGSDGNIAKCLADDDFLESGDVEATFAGFAETLRVMREVDPMATRRQAAERCLAHSIDCQLDALRRGLWKTLPRSTTRLMTPTELELRVCGEPFPTFEQVSQSVVCSLPAPYTDMFWSAMKELSPAEWSGFFYFASAQRRYPLSRKISVTPTKQSESHIPQASTCFSHVSTPLYSSVERWVAKLRQAIGCQDMELA